MYSIPSMSTISININQTMRSLIKNNLKMKIMQMKILIVLKMTSKKINKIRKLKKRNNKKVRLTKRRTMRASQRRRS